MMKVKSTKIYVIFFIVLCVSSVFILYHPKKDTQITSQKIMDHFFLKPIFIEYNQKGAIKSRITAESVAHYKNTQSSFFVKPEILFYADNKLPWKIQAEQGSMEQQNEVVTLSGHVELQELGANHQPLTTIKTTHLIIYPKQSRAETDAPVAIYRQHVVVHGVGLHANFKTGQYVLKSHANAILQPALFHSTHSGKK